MTDDNDARIARALDLAGVDGGSSADDLRRARVQRLADELADAAADGAPLDRAALAEAGRTLAEMGRDDGDDDTERQKPQPVSAFADDVMAEVEARGRGDRRVVPVPIDCLDKIHGAGLRPGVHVLTGGTGTGKTGLALRHALHAARAGCPVLYAGLELDRVSILARLAALTDCTAPPWSVMEWPRTDDAPDDGALDAMRRAADELRRLPLYVSQPPPMGWTSDNLTAEVNQIRQLHPDSPWPVFVIVDFLQIMAGTDDPDDRDIRQRIARTAYAARRLTLDGGACVMLVSSVARDRYPLLSLDLAATGSKAPLVPAALVSVPKEAGEIEYATHSITVLCRTRGKPGEVWAAIAKNRTGHTGYAPLDFDGARGWHADATDTPMGDAPPGRRWAGGVATRGELAERMTEGKDLTAKKPETKPEANTGRPDTAGAM